MISLILNKFSTEDGKKLYRKLKNESKRNNTENGTEIKKLIDKTTEFYNKSLEDWNKYFK